MTLLKFPLDGTDGTTATTANTGCTILAMNGNTAQLLAAAAAQGTTGLRLVGGGVNAGLAEWDLNAPNNVAAYSFFFRVPASIPASAVSLMTVFNTASGRVADLVSYRTDGTVKIIDAGNTSTTLLTAAQATANTMFRVEAQLTVGASTTTGAWSVQIYNTSGTQVGTTATSSTANLTTTAQASIRALLASNVAYTLDVDSVQINDGSSTPIGALVSAAPVVNGVVTANMAVIDATSSTGAGPFTYAISPTTGVSTISAGKYAVPSGVTYTVTVTDPNQQATAKQFVVAGQSSGGFVRSQIRVGGAWTTPVGS